MAICTRYKKKTLFRLYSAIIFWLVLKINNDYEIQYLYFELIHVKSLHVPFLPAACTLQHMKPSYLTRVIFSVLSVLVYVSSFHFMSKVNEACNFHFCPLFPQTLLPKRPWKGLRSATSHMHGMIPLPKMMLSLLYKLSLIRYIILTKLSIELFIWATPIHFVVTFD